MTKRKVAKRFQSFNIVVILSALALFSALIILAGSKSKPPFSENLASSSKYDLSLDMIDDGIYTNFKHNYKFEYPTDKFVLTDSYDDGGSWIYQIKDSGFGKNYIKLNISIYGNGYWLDSYNKLYGLEKSEKLPVNHQIYTKLDSKDFGTYRLIIASIEPVPGAQTDAPFAYSAIWLVENKPAIMLSFFTNPTAREFLLKNKGIFDEIVKSFVFF